MVRIAERGCVPIYRTKCKECNATLEYRQEDIENNYILCPECGSKVLCIPEQDEFRIEEPKNYMSAEVRDAIKNIRAKMVEEFHNNHSASIRNGILLCISIIDSERSNWEIQCEEKLID